MASLRSPACRAAALALYSAAALAALHVVSSLSPVHRYISEYGVAGLTPPGWDCLLGTVFLAMFGAALSLRQALGDTGDPLRRTVRRLMLVAGGGCLALAAYPTDLNLDGAAVTLRGHLHDWTSVVMFAAILWAMYLTQERRWGWRSSGARLVARACFLAEAGGMLAQAGLRAFYTLQGHVPSYIGLTERTVIVALLVWMLALAHDLRDAPAERGQQ